MNKKNFINITLIVLAILLAGASRFISEIPNFTPMLSIALFSGYMFRNKFLAFLLPISAQFLSDIYFGFHPDMFAVYFSFALIVLIGMLNQNKYSFSKSIMWSIVGSVLFFIITNFSVWLTADFYSKDISGLINSFTLAIPFYKNTLLSSMIYSVILFGANELAERLDAKSLVPQKINK